MRYCGSALLGVLLLAGLSSALKPVDPPQPPKVKRAAVAGWHKVESKAGNYSALLPEGQETKSVHDVPVPGDKPIPLYAHGVEKGKSSYSIMYMDYPRAADPDELQPILEAVIGGNARSSKGKVI